MWFAGHPESQGLTGRGLPVALSTPELGAQDQGDGEQAQEQIGTDRKDGVKGWVQSFSSFPLWLLLLLACEPQKVKDQGWERVGFKG